jgi:hypothetical protein
LIVPNVDFKDMTVNPQLTLLTGYRF